MTRFAELIGQELASNVLRRAVREGRVGHAYLFSGPEGVGKLTAALAFAAALNCENPTESGDSCGECSSCRMMTSGHPDVQIISPDGAQTKIKQMQEMRRTSHYAPIKGRWRLVIVEQADTMNDDSSNCILKTLEEPPPYLVILLLSRNTSLLLPTIRSRCLTVRFSHIGLEELADALIERLGASTEDAHFLAAYSEGRPGAAISLLGNESFFEKRRQIVELASKLSSDRRYALRLSEELLRLAQPEKAEGRTQRAAMLSVLGSLVLWYRDLLSISIRGESAQIVNSDLRDKLTSLATDQERISSAIETLLWARRAVEGNANIQIISDVTVMRLTK